MDSLWNRQDRRSNGRAIIKTVACLLVAGLAGACGSAAKDGTADADTDADADAGSARAEGCIVTHEEHPRKTFARRTYDPSSRIITELYSDSASFDELYSQSLYWRLDARGHTLTYAGAGSGSYESFRHDYTRDEHGNATSFLFTYGNWTDLAQPPTGSPFTSSQYEHGYDASGLLQTSGVLGTGTNGTGYEPRSYTYQHDELGRCHQITSTALYVTTVEVREYEDGRLSHTATTSTPNQSSTPAGVPPQPWAMTTRYTYDAQGRPLTQEQDGNGFSMGGASPDGVADLIRRWTYASDGGWTIETLDFTDDVVNDEMEINGVKRLFSHSFETWSAGCVALEAQIPRLTGLECRFPY